LLFLATSSSSSSCSIYYLYSYYSLLLLMFFIVITPLPDASSDPFVVGVSYSPAVGSLFVSEICCC
jgi:hypothetical protein